MEDREAVRREVVHFTGQLMRLRHARAVPVGYIDRPSSANVLRTLELADLTTQAITRDTVRQGPFRSLVDRSLFANLGPGERSALFASTSEVNDRYAAAGQRIAFFYANMGRRAGEANAIIARLELPEWAAQDEQTLEQVHAALYADSELTGLPYVLVRAHELAVVSSLERAEFEAMLGEFMIRNGLSPLPSAKAIGKQLTSSRRR
jgi:NurA domain